jgi:flagellar hook-length control protein FliK
MAETELILNTNLQTSSSSCINCHDSDSSGQNFGVGGNFSDQLTNSLKDLPVDSGKVLPINGKNLPQAILPETIRLETLQPLAFKQLIPVSHSQINVLSLEDVDIGALSEVEPDLLSASILDQQEQIDIFSKNLLQDVSNIASELEQSVALEVQDIGEIVSQINEELSTIPIPVNQVHANPIQQSQLDLLTPVPGIVDNQRSLSSVSVATTASTDAEFHALKGNSDTLAGETLTTTSPQKFDSIESNTDELNNFIAKYLSEESSAKVNTKNQVLSSEVFQQNINVAKSENNGLNVHNSNIVDTYNSLNTGSLINRPIEAPIPLFIKQGIASSQIQQGVDQSIEQNVKWLIGNNAQNAKINVFPESLGQVNIALNLEDSNLKLNFIASSAVTKDLIEASFTALKSQLSESGINLQEVNVETQFSSQPNQDSQFSNFKDGESSQFDHGSATASDHDEELVSLDYVNKSTSNYILDAYV